MQKCRKIHFHDPEGQPDLSDDWPATLPASKKQEACEKAAGDLVFGGASEGEWLTAGAVADYRAYGEK